MKKIALLILISLSSILSFAAPRFTANYYNIEKDKFDGKDVTLYLSSASMLNSSYHNKEGYIAFYCSTYYKELGGTTTIYVANAKAKSFSAKYSNIKNTATISDSYTYRVPTKSCKAKLVKDKSTIYFMID